MKEAAGSFVRGHGKGHKLEVGVRLGRVINASRGGGGILSWVMRIFSYFSLWGSLC